MKNCLTCYKCLSVNNKLCLNCGELYDWDINPSDISDWKELEKVILNLLKICKFKAKRNVKIKGARGEHQIDIYATDDNHPITTSLAIESKFWKTKVKKNDIIAFYQIIKDTGLDKGIIISTHGFQKGAIEFANKYTNIYTMNLQDFTKFIKSKIKNRSIFERVEDLKRELREKHIIDKIFEKAELKYDPDYWESYNKAVIDNELKKIEKKELTAYIFKLTKKIKDEIEKEKKSKFQEEYISYKVIYLGYLFVHASSDLKKIIKEVLLQSVKSFFSKIEKNIRPMGYHELETICEIIPYMNKNEKKNLKRTLLPYLDYSEPNWEITDETDITLGEIAKYVIYIINKS